MTPGPQNETPEQKLTRLQLEKLETDKANDTASRGALWFILLGIPAIIVILCILGLIIAALR
ncbi:MAG: hypothetical protein KY445_04735 [Armatimonadetes bacterium]|nr:hypothetical protein [Armatimonadota bacterium]